MAFGTGLVIKTKSEINKAKLRKRIISDSMRLEPLICESARAHVVAARKHIEVLRDAQAHEEAKAAFEQARQCQNSTSRSPNQGTK